MKYELTIKKNEILTFATTWMDLQRIVLSEISDRERQILYDFTSIWNLKIKTNKHNQIEIDSYIQRTHWWLPKVR